MEMPNYLDYDKMNAMDPWANNQAMAQVDLARQFQQSKQQELQENIKAKSLANLYDEQANPTRLEQGRATLETSNLANRTAGVNARIAERTEPNALQAKLNEYVSKAGQHEIEMIFQGAQKAATSLDPTIRKQGEELLQRTQDALKAKQASLYKIAEEEPKLRSNEKIGAGHDAASRYGADSRERAAAARGKIVGGMDQEILKMKGNPFGIADVYNRYAYKAQKEGDIETAQYLSQQAQYILTEANRKAAAGAAQSGSGSPQLDASTGTLVNRPGAAPVPIAPGLPGNAPPSTAPTSGGPPGWTLHTDANGNKAWVSPDKKQFKEVN